MFTWGDSSREFFRGCSSAGGPPLRHFGGVARGGRRRKKKNTVWLASAVAFYDLRIPPFIDTVPSSENKMSLVWIVCANHSLFTKAYFSPPTRTKKTAPGKKKKRRRRGEEKKASETPKVYRMRGQIYSQSGSRVMWLDAFLQCSFLPLPLSFFEVSPRLPPLPPHSSPFVYSI